MTYEYDTPPEPTVYTCHECGAEHEGATPEPPRIGPRTLAEQQSADFNERLAATWKAIYAAKDLSELALGRLR